MSIRSSNRIAGSSKELGKAGRNSGHYLFLSSLMLCYSSINTIVCKCHIRLGKLLSKKEQFFFPGHDAISAALVIFQKKHW